MGVQGQRYNALWSCVDSDERDKGTTCLGAAISDFREVVPLKIMVFHCENTSNSMQKLQIFACGANT